MMRQVIDGLTCDTEAAVAVCDVSSDDEIGSGDLDYMSAQLYRAPEGHYFIAGEGGARTLFARSDGGAWSCPGSGIRVVDQDTAFSFAEIAEAHCDEGVMDRFFGRAS